MSQGTEQSSFSPTGPLAVRIKGHKIQRSESAIPQTFYRNLEDALDVRRQSDSFHSMVRAGVDSVALVDFSSNDVLSLSTSGVLSKEFIAELNRHPVFETNSGGSRIVEGSYPYLEQTEKEIANFHGYDAGVIMNSGFDANIAIWSAIPRPGDVMMYDEASHASTIDGMKQSLTKHKHDFKHNDVESFRLGLLSIFENYPMIRQGKRTVLVSVEATYSMDGDICPLREFVDVAMEISGYQGNVEFVIDEAYGTGILGPSGKGLVSELSLEKEVAIVVHSFSKGLGCQGAIVVGNTTIMNAISNFARCFQFTTAPPLPHVAMIKASYNLATTGPGDEARNHIQFLARSFFEGMSGHPLWNEAIDRGLLSVPLADDWEERQVLSPIVVLKTTQQYIFWLYFHLQLSKFNVMMATHPAVPMGESRIKITIHNSNSKDEIIGLVHAVYSWVEEMIAMKNSGGPSQIPSAAARVYEWMKTEKITGFGMI